MDKNEENDIASNVAELFLTDKMTDVTFVIITENEVPIKFPAHKLIMSIRSSVFYTMFSGEYKEKTAKEVTLLDTNADAFETILRFIYTDQLILGDCKHIRDVLYLAEKYLLPSVIFDECVIYLASKISMDTFVDIYDIASIFYTNKGGYGKLRRRLWKFLTDKGEYLIQTKAFTRLDFESISELLRRDSINIVSEVTIFECLDNWATFKCLHQGLQITPENKRQVLKSNLYLVRYINMSLGEFLEGPAASNLLTREDVKQILNIITNHGKVMADCASSFFTSISNEGQGSRTCVEKFKCIETSIGVELNGTQTVESLLLFSTQDTILTHIKYVKEVSNKVKISIVNMENGKVLYTDHCRCKAAEPNIYIKANVVYKILTYTTSNVLPVGLKRRVICNSELHNGRLMKIILKSYTNNDIDKKQIIFEDFYNAVSRSEWDSNFSKYSYDLSTVIHTIWFLL